MDIFLIYIIGVVIFGIGIYCHKIYNKEYIYYSKKQLGYKAFKTGLLSWVGILIILAFLMTCALEYIDNWINEKLA